MADSPSEANLAPAHRDSDWGDFDETLERLRTRMADSQERIAELEGELEAVVDEETETAQLLGQERQRRHALEQQVAELRREATRFILNGVSRLTGAGLTGDGEQGEGDVTDNRTTALVGERDQLAGEVAELTDALAAAQVELAKTNASLHGQRDAIPAQYGYELVEQRDAAGMSDEPDAPDRSIEPPAIEVKAVQREELENRDEQLPDDETERPTRYERASAKLPSIGEDASEVVGSLEDLRNILRRG
jgi:hypothetical protein